MTRIDKDLEERKHHRKVVRGNWIKLGLLIGILLLFMIVVFKSIIIPWINSVAPIVQQNTIKVTRNTVAQVASTDFDLGIFTKLPIHLTLIAAAIFFGATYLFPYYKRWKQVEEVDLTVDPARNKIEDTDKEEDEDGENEEDDSSTNVKRKKVKLDPFTPEEGQRLRMIICFYFHLILGLIVHLLLQKLVYEVFPAWISELATFVFWGALVASVWTCFDSSSIDPNHAAEMTYFGRNAWSNIKQGFFCYGIPPWLGAEIEVVDFGEQMITIGHVDGKKVPFIVECRGFRAIFDIAFSVCANNTRIVIKLRGDLEKQLVTGVNEAVYRIVNRKATVKDKNGLDKLDKQKNPILLDPIGKDEHGAPIYMDAYPNIGTLKSSTAELSYLLLSERPNNLNKTETAVELLSRLGHELTSVYVKDVENEDKSIINAQQKLEATKILEEAEMIDLENSALKVDRLYARLNRINESDEVPEKDRITRKQCLEFVQAKEGDRKISDIKGTGKPIVVT